MSSRPPAPPPHPLLDRLMAEVSAPVRRVIFARGVEAHRTVDGGWSPPPAPPSVPPATPTATAATLAALGLRPVAPGEASTGRERRGPEGGVDPVGVAAEHGLAPLLLVTTDATHLVSAAGALGWRPPLERLYDDPSLGARALRLRFLLDGIEHHAARSAEGYAASAATARRTAALFGAHELATLAGAAGLFVELDALLWTIQRTYAGAGHLLAAAFAARGRGGERGGSGTARHAPFDALVLGARAAPAELRETLLAAWERHGAHASVYRRALRARDAAELGRAPVRPARLACGVWAVSVPLPTAPGDGGHSPPRRVDALDRAWAMATDAMRVVSLVVYAAAER